VGADDKVVEVHRPHLGAEQLRDVRPDLRVLAAGVEGGDQVESAGEQPGAERRCHCPFGEVGVMVEELEVLAPVEDVEELLVLTWTKQVGAQAGAATEHLPELGFGPHQLEEHEVGDLGDVDAGVEHVDRDGDVRDSLRDLELLDQVIGLLDLVGDGPGELASVRG
jgi:hypothetical protein